MPVSIKLCGLSDRAAIDTAIRLRADYAGMIFFPASPRNVSVEDAALLAAHARGRIKTVAVVVDAGNALLTRIASEVRPDFFQLHGSETPARVAEIKTQFGIPVIRAVKVSSGDDIAAASAYTHADMLLFDARPPAQALPGGNGLVFDWHLLAGRAISLPWFLSGGLSAQNVAEAVRISGAKLVDVSSGVESAPGVKDVQKMQGFVKAVHA